MKAINENMKVHEEWYERAKKMTLTELPEFLRELTEDYDHDYGTICHAIAAAAIGAAWAVHASPAGGITGFQAGQVMWQFLREWNHSSNKTGLKLIDYDNLLYPQYEYKMIPLISPQVWDNLQKEAEARMKETNAALVKYAGDKRKYVEDLKAFVEKYPDYYDRREYYDHLGMGNGDQWEEYHKKVDEGFEFAPREPCYSCSTAVYQHWKSIVDGKVPFGYQVEED